MLDSLVETLPATLAELEQIKGIGKNKVQQYGEEVLAYINAYCKNQNIERKPFTVDTEKIKVKSASAIAKTDTKQVSFDLFQSGKTIAEIAAERDYVASTIEGHLAYFVDLGELEITQIFPQETISKIRNYLSKNQPENLNEIKNALGEEVSYSAIRAVVKLMDYQYPQKIAE